MEIVVGAIAVAAGCLALAVWAEGQGRPWQTMVFTTLALAQLGIALVSRSDHRPVWRMAPSGNPFLYLAVAASLGAVLAAVYLPGLSDLLDTAPLTGVELALAAGIAADPAVLIEAGKTAERAWLRGADRRGPYVSSGLDDAELTRAPVRLTRPAPRLENRQPPRKVPARER